MAHPRAPTLGLVARGFLLAAIAVMPARWVIASTQGRSPRTFALFFAGGLVSDLAVVGPFVAIGLLLFVFAGPASKPGRPTWRSRAAAAILGAGLVALSLAHDSAALFRTQRGVFPGPLDVRDGLAAPELFVAELPEIVFGRFFVPNLAALARAALVLHHARSPAAPSPVRLRGRFMASALGALGLATGALGFVSHEATAFCVSLHNGGALTSPAAAFLGGLSAASRVSPAPGDIRRLLAAASPPGGDLAKGAAHFGFPRTAPEAVLAAEAHADCEHHPLARSLDDDTVPLVRETRALSRALFAGRDELPIVHQVSLESFRGDDITALEPMAPPEIAPFMNRVYGGAPEAIAFRLAHQSGMRTAHALAAATCGVGALPYNLAFGRDLGNVPFRCLPDVLQDAGFDTRIVYGHELAFDDMGTFLAFHGMKAHERDDFPKTAPRGVWGGVSDTPVYEAAYAAARGASRAQYTFTLTLSHHTPYTEPADLGEADRRAVDEVCARLGLHGENCARLRTLRYADDALARFVDMLERSSEADRTIVVFAADHTTHQWVPWTGAETAYGITRIPVVLWIPKALRARAHDPGAVDDALGRLQELARKAPISNTDLPTLVLALLSEARGLRELAPKARFHTLGGQATSPDFASPSSSDGRVFGVDAHAHLFDVSPSGEVRPSPTTFDTLRTRDDLTRPPPEAASMLAFLGRFLRGYAAQCPRAPSGAGQAP